MVRISKNQNRVKQPPGTAPRGRGRPRKVEGEAKPFLLRLPEELHLELRHHALDEGRSLQDVLVEVIQEWWEKQRSRTTKRTAPRPKK